jgi:lipopolysaccharide transport system ATP-binding protein
LNKPNSQMSETIISVQGLSKRFIISHQKQGGYTALRDVITDKARSLMRPVAGAQAPEKEEFWALRDLDFQINRGDRVGIIGRNGAGKSTLLKILSRITEPTHGRITINGRVASLLEVGTGFHPELTGRENIFLNGAILGMSRREISSKFDEIVAFAEVERFLDTPVKRFSSGMYVRLAFAVAAHLEPEILVVDEVLAVGDLQFQRKCLGKMEEVSQKDGRTVLFVSHNMIAIQQLCNDLIVLHRGELIYHGARAKGMIEYERLNRDIMANHAETETSIRFTMLKSGDADPESMSGNEGLRFVVVIQAHRNYGKSWVNIVVDNGDGLTVSHLRNDWYGVTLDVEKGMTKVEVDVPDMSLAPGIYTIWVRVALTEELIVLDSEPRYIEVTGTHIYGYTALAASWSVTKG